MICLVYKTNKNKKYLQTNNVHSFYALYWSPDETNSKKKAFTLMEFR